MDQTAFSILRHRDFRLWFSGQALFLFSSKAQGIVLTWLAYTASDSAMVLGAAAALTLLPLLVLGPVGGLLSDRYDERYIVMLTQGAFTALSLMMAVMQATGHLGLPWIMVFCLLMGIVTGFDSGPRPALVQRIVDDRALLPKAITLNALAYHASRFIGPAFAGVLLASAGADVCFLVNALCGVPLLWTLARLRPAGEKPPQATPGLMEGFAYVARHAETRLLVLVLCCVGLLATPYVNMLPWFVREVFAGSSTQYGTFFAATGLGSLLASFFIALRPRDENLARACLRSFAVACALIALFAETTVFWPAAALLLGAGFSFTHGMVLLNTQIQMTVPAEVRGRVLAIISMAGLGTMPLGSLLLAAADGYIGMQAALAAGAVFTAGVSFLFWQRQARFPLPVPVQAE